jgi:integrase/recombinase XerD
MATNIILSLDTRRIRKDGTYPVVLRLGHKARTTSIPTGITVTVSDWDDKQRKIKNSYKGASSVTRLNNMLQKMKADAMDIVLKLQEAGTLDSMTVTELRARVTRNSDSASFFSFTATVIDDLRRAHRIGTARSYHEVMRLLQTYMQGKELLLNDIDYSFLQAFETWHIGKGNGLNSLAVYMRTIRALYNKAIKSGLVETDRYPFARYKIRTTPTRKRALDDADIQAIINLQLAPEHPCFDARNIFIASYMMYGMNFIDMAHLQKSDIVQGRIQYRRRKTSKLYDIKITPALAEIIAHYTAASPDRLYIFPIIKRTTVLEQDKDVLWARKRHNERLHELGTLCGIATPLTSYVSRHSFATLAMQKDVPLNAISAMLGHSSLKTTEIYLKSLPAKTLDDFNAALLNTASPYPQKSA